DGNIMTRWNLPTDSPGFTFTTTATGATSGSASTSFNGLTTWVLVNPNDYVPGQDAQIYSGGFRPGETVDFAVSNLTNGNSYTPPWSVTDGGQGDLDGVADGHIHTTWNVVQDALNSRLKVTAIGETSGLTAQNTFTDANSPNTTNVAVN